MCMATYIRHTLSGVLFGLTMFNLPGAINVLLFLIIRPQLLLFTPPEKPAELEAQISM